MKLIETPRRWSWHYYIWRC